MAEAWRLRQEWSAAVVVRLPQAARRQWIEDAAPKPPIERVPRPVAVKWERAASVQHEAQPPLQARPPNAAESLNWHPAQAEVRCSRVEPARILCRASLRLPPSPEKEKDAQESELGASLEPGALNRGRWVHSG